MIFIINYFLDGVEAARFELPRGKAIRLGVGRDVDFQLTYCLKMPDLCAQIWNGDEGYDGCILENISRKAGLVFLNGNPVHSVALLEGGDFIQIGMDQFQVLCRKETTVPHSLPTSNSRLSEKAGSPGVDYTLQCSAVNSAVNRYSPLDSKWGHSDLLIQLFRKHPVILFVNFRLAGIAPAAPELVGPDHFQDAPEELRSKYSLHTILGGTPGQKLQFVDKLRLKDAVVVAIPDGERDTCFEESRPFWSWFACPSVLETTLIQGDTNLARELLRPFRGLIMKPRIGANEWIVYAKPGTNLDHLAPPAS